MRPSKLIIENFGPYNGRHKFSFADGAPGLHFVVGRNEVQWRLESNGAGKSALFAGMYWTCYGKDPRGRKAGEIQNWDTDETVSGRLWFRSRKHDYQLIRKWKPNVLKLSQDGGEFRVVTQDQVDQVIGLNAMLAAQTWFVSQFKTPGLSGGMFFDLGSAEKLKVFSKLMDLDKWEDCAKEAGRRRDNAGKILSELSIKRETLAKPLGHAQNEYTKIIGQMQNHLDKAESLAQGMRKNLKVLRRKLLDLKDELGRWESKRQKAGDAVNAAGQETARLQERAADSQVELNKVDREIVEYRIRKQTLKNLYAQIDGVEGECPVCRQEIDQEHLRQERKKINGKLKKVQGRLREALAEKAEITTRFDNRRAKVQKALEYHEATKRTRDTITQQAHVVETELARVRTSRKAAKDELARHKAGENPYDGLVKAAKQQLDEVQGQVNAINADVAKYEKRFAKNNEWVSLFKKVRLFLIEDSLAELQIEVGNALTALGLIDWQVKFDIERETQSGGSEPGFHTFILPPGHEKPISWESWSGGETQRLRLAGTMGFNATILSHAGVDQGLEIWDEPTDRMSPAGIDDLLACLQQRARDLKRQIWLIDHRTHSHGSFDSVTEIRKTEDGSQIGKTQIAEGE